MALTNGTKLGPYEIQSLLGRAPWAARLDCHQGSAAAILSRDASLKHLECEASPAKGPEESDATRRGEM